EDHNPRRVGVGSCAHRNCASICSKRHGQRRAKEQADNAKRDAGRPDQKHCDRSSAQRHVQRCHRLVRADGRF
ncbi:MAG: hypothetical protein AVDCRST_MAG93-8099, partial [uncultured Chloroflexia bacterium]